MTSQSVCLALETLQKSCECQSLIVLEKLLLTYMQVGYSLDPCLAKFNNPLYSDRFPQTY